MADIKPKKHYIVIVEGLAPIIAEYRVLAEDEEQALKEFDRGRIVRLERPPNIIPQKIMRRKISIRDQLTGIINKIVNY